MNAPHFVNIGVIGDEYETSVEHTPHLSVSTVGLHIMLPPPVSIMMS